MRHWTMVLAFGAASLACAAVGCAADPTTTSAGASSSGHPVIVDTTPTTMKAGTVLASIKTSEGHTIVFGRSERGDLVVAENAPVGDSPILTADVTRGSITDVFARVSEGAAVPESITTAEAARPVVHPVTAPPSVKVMKPEIIIPTLTPTQKWFENSFCAPTLPYMTICDVPVFYGAINANLSQWLYDSNYYSYGLNDPSNTGTAAMLEYVWNGSSWQFDWISGTMNPGTYWYEFWWNSGPVYRSTELSTQGLGGVAMGGITASGLQASYTSSNEVWNFNVGGPKFSTQWPNDAEIECYVAGNYLGTNYNIWVDKPGVATTLNGINLGGGGGCLPCQDQACVNNTWQAYCKGKTTGQQASTSVTTSYWAPGNCCVSEGGNRSGC